MAHLFKSVPSREGDETNITVRRDFEIYRATHGIGRKSKADVNAICIMVSFVIHFLFSNIKGIVWGEMGRDDIDRRGLLGVRDHCSHGVGVLAFSTAVIPFLHCCLPFWQQHHLTGTTRYLFPTGCLSFWGTPCQSLACTQILAYPFRGRNFGACV